MGLRGEYGNVIVSSIGNFLYSYSQFKYYMYVPNSYLD